MGIISCNNPTADTAVEAAGDRIIRAEPLSWWVGMRTPLQLMVQGKDISSCEVEMARGTRGVKVTATHKADNPDFLFIDIDIAPDAAAGEYMIEFTRGEESFSLPYRLEKRRDASAKRKSFTTADMIYLLMPDRFANGDPANDATENTREKPDRAGFFSRHGGDIQGMIDHLDYIASTGATAVWSTPLLLDDEPHGSYHGYACADYYHIDPRFGSNDLYRTFVAESHRHGLKVIMDIVTNHCGSAHWWMRDMPFEDWVHRFPQYTRTNNLFSTNMDPNASQSDLEIQESGWFDRSMPDMNLDNPYLLQYFKQWAVWWIEYADLDGLRVDTYPYNEKEPMSEWCRAVREEYPDINIVGECWTGNIPQLAYWQGGNGNRDGFDTHLPSIMDFPLPGGPTMRKLWPPATAISAALFTAPCPLTSWKSPTNAVSAFFPFWMAVFLFPDGSLFPSSRSRSWARLPAASTGTPSTRVASASLPAGTMHSRYPCFLASHTMGRTPGTSRMLPSSPSSPTVSTRSSASCLTRFWDARIARAMGRSKEAPLFLTLPGDRLITVFFTGISRPLLRIAVRTRSPASFTSEDR